MRVYNVYTWATADNNPENYPSEKIRLIENAVANSPVPPNAQRMTVKQINDYKASIKTNINTWVATKVAPATQAGKRVKKAIKNVNELIKRFASENIVMGITQAGKTKLIADALKDVHYYAQTGSLYECLTAIDAVDITPEMAPFLTSERRTQLKTDLINILTNL